MTSLLAVVALFAAPRAFAIDSGDIVVESVKGEVRVTMHGALRAVHAGSVLDLPASVSTGRDGAVDLRQGHTTVSVGPDTQLEFPALEKPAGPIDRIVQPRGNAFYNIGKREGHRLRVETPYLVGVIKGTQFNVAAQDESTTISLFEGLLEVRASDDSDVIDLKAGEIASRRRGDKTISVIKMDAGKAPPTQRAPAAAGGSNSTPPANVPRPAPARDDGDSVLVDRGVTLRPVVGTVVEAAIDVRPASVDVNAAGSIDVGNSGAAAGVTAAVAAGAVDLGVAANVDVGNAASVNAGVSTTIDAGAGSVSADVAANANVALGAAANADLGASAAVDLGTGAAASVDVNAGANAGPLTTAVGAGVAVDLAGNNAASNVDLGAAANVGNVAAVDTAAAAAVDLGSNVGAAATVDVGASVAGVDAGVSTAVDVAAGNVDLGVTVAGADLSVGVDLGLGKDDTTDTTTTTPPPPVTPVIDVGGLLDGLFRKPGKK